MFLVILILECFFGMLIVFMGSWSTLIFDKAQHSQPISRYKSVV